MERGYEVATRIRDDRALPEFELTEPDETATSGHGSFFPAEPSARTLAIFAGPGFEPGDGAHLPVPIVDLAPTVTAFLGISRSARLRWAFNPLPRRAGVLV